MVHPVADVTIEDFAAWDGRLTPRGPTGELSMVDVSWVIAARSSPPMLPVMRGGEIVLVSPAVIDVVADELPRMSDELLRAGVAAIGLPAGLRIPPISAAVPMVEFKVDGTVETMADELNRSLVELRTTLYRAGNEIADIIAEQLRGTPAIGRLLEVVAHRLDVDLMVVDEAGAVRHLAGLTVDTTRGFPQRLNSELELWASPRDPRRRAVARVAADRVAAGIQVILDRAEADRPRGSARTALLRGLLSGDPPRTSEERRQIGLRLGLPSEGRFRIVLMHPSRSAAESLRRVSDIGIMTPAGDLSGAAVFLLEGDERSPGSGGLVKRFLSEGLASGTRVGISSEVADVAMLPEAVRQAVEALKRTGAATGREVAVFDDPLALGVQGLLDRYRNDPAMVEFIAAVLGDLPQRDRRGVLQETLEAYVACGGAQVETADRLGIHRNTLAYRLKQISELTGSDPSTAEGRLELHLALLAKRARGRN